MNQALKLIPVLIIALFATASIAVAEVPQMINYQGQLTDDLGQPVSDIVSMTFTIYDEASGGSALWTETQSSVTVTDGMFSVLLGSVNAVHDTIFSDPERYLGIAVGADAEISPRTQLVSAAYAYQAGAVEGFSPGPHNVSSGLYTFVAGDSNTAIGDYVSISGGYGNYAEGINTTDTSMDTTETSGAYGFNSMSVGPVNGSMTTPCCDWSLTCPLPVPDPPGCDPVSSGGYKNDIKGVGASHVGGAYNVARSGYCAVVGGACNEAGDPDYPDYDVITGFEFIGGGLCNRAMPKYSVVVGGYLNQICGQSINSAIGGGAKNCIYKASAGSVIGGGFRNDVIGDYITIGGGKKNTAGENIACQPSYVAVCGGHDNVASGEASFIGGGGKNTASGQYSAIGGGQYNKASKYWSTVPGGYGNMAFGTHSFAAGNQALAEHNGSFVWADNTNAVFKSTGEDQFLIRAHGGVGINVNDPSSFSTPVDLDIADQIRIRGGGPAFGHVLTCFDAYGTAVWQTPTAATDGDWRPDPVGATEVLFTYGAWGVARDAGNTLHGTAGGRTTHINLGSNSTTGESGQNHAYCTVGGGNVNRATRPSSTVSGGHGNSATGNYSTVGGGHMNDALDSYSTVSGGFSNTASGTYGATVAGGFNNIASGDYSFAVGERSYANGAHSTVSGGHWNNVTATSDHSVIGGGGWNEIQGSFSTIGGGDSNWVSADHGTIAGGDSNSVGGDWGTIGGGRCNIAYGLHPTIGGGDSNLVYAKCGTVSGGAHNYAYFSYATVGGGNENLVTGGYGTIAGGDSNAVGGDYSAIGGGAQNLIQGGFSHATIGGGWKNTASGDYGTIGGGRLNVNYGSLSTIGGGDTNTVTAGTVAGTIAGGDTNTVNANYGTIGGGSNNQVNERYGFIGGGFWNKVLPGADYGTIAGGMGNTASGQYATIPGGSQNVASGANSFAAGTLADAKDACSFVWSDCCAGPYAAFLSAGDNTFNVRAHGGIYMYTSCDLQDGVYLPANGNAWQTKSDSTLKRNIRPANGKEILDKLSGLPISQWSYRAQDPSIEHIGPMAQDFYAAFGLGHDDKTISTIDPDGIALAAAKELYKMQQELQRTQQELKKKVQRIEKLETRLGELDQLKAQMAQLQILVETLLAQQNGARGGNDNLALNK